MQRSSQTRSANRRLSSLIPYVLSVVCIEQERLIIRPSMLFKSLSDFRLQRPPSHNYTSLYLLNHHSFDYIYKCLCKKEIIEKASREGRAGGWKFENKRKSISGFSPKNPKKGIESAFLSQDLKSLSISRFQPKKSQKGN